MSNRSLKLIKPPTPLPPTQPSSNFPPYFLFLGCLSLRWLAAGFNWGVYGEEGRTPSGAKPSRPFDEQSVH